MTTENIVKTHKCTECGGGVSIIGYNPKRLKCVLCGSYKVELRKGGQ